MKAKETLLTLLSRTSPNFFRVLVMRILGAKFGKRTYIGPGAIVAPGVVLGESCRIGQYTRIYRNANIGDNVSIGSYTKMNEVNVSSGCSVGSYCSIANMEIEENSHIERGVAFTGFRKGHISIGSNCYLGIGTVMDWSGNITIGDYVHIAGPSASFWTHSSVFQALNADPLSDHSLKITDSISIGSNCWIGGGVVFYPGVTVGDHSIVLPNSVVNRDVVGFSMVGGNPCKLIKKVEADSEQKNKFLLRRTESNAENISYS